MICRFIARLFGMQAAHCDFGPTYHSQYFERPAKQLTHAKYGFFHGWHLINWVEQPLFILAYDESDN